MQQGPHESMEVKKESYVQRIEAVKEIELPIAPSKFSKKTGLALGKKKPVPQTIQIKKEPIIE